VGVGSGPPRPSASGSPSCSKKAERDCQGAGTYMHGWCREGSERAGCSGVHACRQAGSVLMCAAAQALVHAGVEWPPCGWSDRHKSDRSRQGELLKRKATGKGLSSLQPQGRMCSLTQAHTMQDDAEGCCSGAQGSCSGTSSTRSTHRQRSSRPAVATCFLLLCPPTHALAHQPHSLANLLILSPPPPQCS